MASIFRFLFLPIFTLSSFPSISHASSLQAVPLSFFPQHPTNPFHRITLLASNARARARHLKNGYVSTAPLSPFAGAYSITLGFGTPPQHLPMFMDTGSTLSWLPCTNRYRCSNCPVSSPFMPRQSSSARIVGCLNPKCSWIHKSFDSRASCPNCSLPEKGKCTEICPPYVILYGSGSTGGVAMVEKMTVSSEKSVPDFLIGCSVYTANLPAGIAGFGRGNASIPNQLGLKKFSYCLASHKFDKNPRSSLLLMDWESDSDEKTRNLTYTPLLENPNLPEKTALSEYYYVGLRKFTIGDKKVDVNYEEISTGNGGTIVDSGSTLTYMTRAVFDSVSEAFVEQVKEYNRSSGMEAATGLRPCFQDVRRNAVKMPEMKLHFKGGGKMFLPLENYFVGVRDGKNEALCFAAVSDGAPLGPETAANGPAVILGNLFLQNFSWNSISGTSGLDSGSSFALENVLIDCWVSCIVICIANLFIFNFKVLNNIVKKSFEW